MVSLKLSSLIGFLFESYSDPCNFSHFLPQSNSNIACFSAAGHEVSIFSKSLDKSTFLNSLLQLLQLWTNRISGAPDEEAKIADINLDGTLDIVIGTNVGHIWAIDGKSGEILDKFPMRVGGRVLGKVLVGGVREEGSEKVKKFVSFFLNYFYF